MFFKVHTAKWKPLPKTKCPLGHHISAAPVLLTSKTLISAVPYPTVECAPNSDPTDSFAEIYWRVKEAPTTGAVVAFSIATNTLIWPEQVDIAAGQAINITAALGFTPVLDAKATSSDQRRLFTVAAAGSLSINGPAITLRGGYVDGSNGGCVLNAGTLITEDVTFKTNRANKGGAVYSSGAFSVLALSTTTFVSNQASASGYKYGGDLYVASGKLLLFGSDSTFQSATSHGAYVPVSIVPLKVHTLDWTEPTCGIGEHVAAAPVLLTNQKDVPFPTMACVPNTDPTTTFAEVYWRTKYALASETVFTWTLSKSVTWPTQINVGAAQSVTVTAAAGAAAIVLDSKSTNINSRRHFQVAL